MIDYRLFMMIYKPSNRYIRRSFLTIPNILTFRTFKEFCISFPQGRLLQLIYHQARFIPDHNFIDYKIKVSCNRPKNHIPKNIPETNIIYQLNDNWKRLYNENARQFPISKNMKYRNLCINTYYMYLFFWPDWWADEFTPGVP